MRTDSFEYSGQSENRGQGPGTSGVCCHPGACVASVCRVQGVHGCLPHMPASLPVAPVSWKEQTAVRTMGKVCCSLSLLGSAWHLQNTALSTGVSMMLSNSVRASDPPMLELMGVWWGAQVQGVDLSKACMEVLASLPALDSLGLDSLQLDGSFQPLARITQLTCLSVRPALMHGCI